MIIQGQTRDYLLAFAQMKMPYDLVFTIMAGIRFLPMLREEALNVFYSVQLRGSELKKISMPQKLNLYGKICLPILINTINRCKDISMAVEAKGFRAHNARTYARRLQLRRMDVFVMILYPIVTIAIYLSSMIF
jgi:energy-coupling factor transport system permease protein